MYKELIKKWIPNITPTIIKEYGEKIGIKLKDSETTILYQFIKKNYSEILDGNEKSLETLKKSLNPSLYQEIYKIYQDAKVKYL